MKIFLLTIFTFIFGLSVFGQTQEFEYGKPEELKGLKRLYIMPTANEETRRKFIDAVQKSKTGLEVVDDPKYAEMVIKFRPDNNKCLVAVRGQNLAKPRILLQLKSPKDYKPEENPAEKFIKKFLQAYKSANSTAEKNIVQDLPNQTTVPVRQP